MKAIVTVDDEVLITQVLQFQLSKNFDENEIIIESINRPELTIDLVKELDSLGISTCLMIVDYQMPKMNGAQLIRQLKSVYPNIHFIMLSGQANSIIVAEMQEEGLVDAFIYKPWDENELIQLVKDKIS
ncbi:MAG: hypothetical protein RL131_1177 [Bacteroidota bacterium]|jgi:DNA-binding NarL/FixJ family response regulator